MVIISSANPDNIVAFRWTYIILPASILVIAVILTAVFYAQLPNEVAYRFSDGEPTHVTGRGGVIAWVIGLQFVFAVLSLILVFIATSTSRRMQIEETGLNRSVFTVMGNLPGLIQIILLFAMLDIFLYNAYQIKLIPVWVFTVIVLILGGLVLGFYFIRAIRQARRLRDNNSGSDIDDRD